MDRLPHDDVDPGQVAVPGLRAVGVLDEDLVAVPAEDPRGEDPPRQHRDDRRSVRRGEVEPPVVGRARPAPDDPTTAEAAGGRDHPVDRTDDARRGGSSVLTRDSGRGFPGCGGNGEGVPLDAGGDGTRRDVLLPGERDGGRRGLRRRRRRGLRRRDRDDQAGGDGRRGERDRPRGRHDVAEGAEGNRDRPRQRVRDGRRDVAHGGVSSGRGRRCSNAPSGGELVCADRVGGIGGRHRGGGRGHRHPGGPGLPCAFRCSFRSAEGASGREGARLGPGDRPEPRVHGCHVRLRRGRRRRGRCGRPRPRRRRRPRG